MSDDDATSNRSSASGAAIKWTLLYLLIAGFWIWTSSGLFYWLLPQATPELLSLVEIVKGMFFVGVTGGVLYVLIGRRMKASIASQEALCQSEHRYRQLVETAEEGVWVIDAGGKTTFVNNKMTSMLGYTVQEMLGQPFDRFVDAESVSAMAADLEGSRQGIRLRRDMRFRRKDGERLWMIVSSTPMFDERGACAGVLATVTDITARKQAEALLIEAEAKYRALVEESLVGVYIVQEGRFVYVNPRFAEIFGYTQQEIVSEKTVAELMAPESRQIVAENLRKRLEGEVHSMHYTFTALRKDGTRIDAEVLGSRTIYHGRPAVIGSLLDITERKKSEQALQRSERRFRQLVERAADALFLHDTEGKIIDVNQQACDALGYTREELQHLSVSDIEMEFRRVDLSAIWSQILCKGPITLQGIHRRKDGSCFPVEIRLAAFDSQEQPLILALVRDISDRKRAEQALRQSEERFRGIYQESPIGIELYDANGRLVDANRACLEIFGIADVEDVRGFDLFADPNLPRDIFEAMRQGRRGECEMTFDFDLVRRLGLYRTTRSGTADLHLLVTPLYLERPGQLSGYLLHIEDISIRKQTERALQFTQFAVDRAADGIFWLDEEARFVYVNEAACRSLGYTREELLSMRVHDIDPNFPVEIWPGHLEELKRRRFMVFDSQHRMKGGRVFPIEVMSNYLEFEGKVHICTFTRNVTERRRLEEQLRQSQKMEAVGRLAGGVAHDFNNLLAVIGGYSESLQRHLEADSPLRIHAEEIGRAAERGASLTRRLLAFSRRQVVKPQPLDLNQVIRDLQEMLRRTIRKTISIEYRLSDGLWKVKADSGQMEQVIVNLALNARDAMEQEGRLIFRTENVELNEAQFSGADPRPGRYVKLSVEDTGVGMEPEVQTRIFEPFFTTKEGKGTGLGLSIVYGIVKQAGGCIDVRSEPQKGTAFDILLPCMDEYE